MAAERLRSTHAGHCQPSGDCRIGMFLICSHFFHQEKIYRLNRALPMMLPMNLPESPECSQKQSGAFFTPEGIARSLTAWAARRTSDRMLDPSCGDGSF